MTLQTDIWMDGRPEVRDGMGITVSLLFLRKVWGLISPRMNVAGPGRD